MESPELIKQFEYAECVAWRSLYLSPLPAIAAELGIGCFEHVGAVLVWNRAAPAPIINRLLGLGVFSPADDQTISIFLERSRAEQCPCLIHVAPIAQPNTIVDSLVARGLRQTYRWQVQYTPLEQLQHVDIESMYSVELVTAANAPAWAESLLIGWQLTPRTAVGFLALAIAIAGKPDWKCYAITYRPTGAIVAGGSLYVVGNVAGLFFDSVVPAHRGRDLHLKLIQLRLNEAFGQGCEYAFAPTQLDGIAEENMRRAGLDQSYERLNYVMERATK